MVAQFLKINNKKFNDGKRFFSNFLNFIKCNFAVNLIKFKYFQILVLYFFISLAYKFKIGK